MDFTTALNIAFIIAFLTVYAGVYIILYRHGRRLYKKPQKE
jgi:hypothetical protein